MKNNPRPESDGAAIPSSRPKRKMRSKLERRQIVEETFVPGASVAVIARSHGVNANQVFYWRKLYREGHLDVPPSPTQFLPARIIDSGQIEQRGIETKRHHEYLGAIDIEIGSVRVRITGSADPDSIRIALEQLHR
jgi:transposase